MGHLLLPSLAGDVIRFFFGSRPAVVPFAINFASHDQMTNRTAVIRQVDRTIDRQVEQPFRFRFGVWLFPEHRVHTCWGLGNDTSKCRAAQQQILYELFALVAERFVAYGAS
jgi:hypothetical protein